MRDRRKKLSANLYAKPGDLKHSFDEIGNPFAFQ